MIFMSCSLPVLRGRSDSPGLSGIAGEHCRGSGREKSTAKGEKKETQEDEQCVNQNLQITIFGSALHDIHAPAAKSFQIQRHIEKSQLF